MDFDKDGDLDLLVGEKYESVHYYQRQSDGSLKEQPLLIKLEKPPESTPEQPLAYMSISPDIVDWTGAGRYDVVLGSDVYKSGRAFPVRWYHNTGTPTAPVFNSYDTLKDKTGQVIYASSARVDVADLNLDGKKDLLVGNEKVIITYYKNVGTNEKPVFESNRLVPSATFGIPDCPDFQQMAGFGYGTPRVYDWNKDGSPDLFLSGYPTGKILIYINDAPVPIQKAENRAQGLQQTMNIHLRYPGLRISYTIAQASLVSLTLLDARGRAVNEAVNAFQDAGIHQVDLNGESISEGIYLIQVQTGKTSMIRRVVLTR